MRKPTGRVLIEEEQRNSGKEGRQDDDHHSALLSIVLGRGLSDDNQTLKLERGFLGLEI